MQEVGVKIKLIEPGGVKREVGISSVEFAKNSIEEYEPLKNKVHASTWFPSFTDAKDVAGIIYNATIDKNERLRYIIGADSSDFLAERGIDLRNEGYLKSTKNRFK